MSGDHGLREILPPSDDLDVALQLVAAPQGPIDGQHLAHLLDAATADRRVPLRLASLVTCALGALDGVTPNERQRSLGRMSLTVQLVAMKATGS